jgi:hypothetical protein
MSSRSRDAMRPSCAFIFRPQEGVGNAGCPLHPQPRMHFALVERTRVTTSTPESPGIPARNGFTAYFALSPVTGLFCHRRRRMYGSSAPGRADLPSANLTPASGRQDHTTSPYAAIVTRPRAVDRSQIFRPALRSPCAQNAAASTASRPAFVTMANAPLVGWDAKSSRCDLGCAKTEIFLQRGLDCPNQIEKSRQIALYAPALGCRCCRPTRRNSSCPGRSASSC